MGCWMSDLVPCTHRPTCPGCPRYGEEGPPPRAFERLVALARELGAPAPTAQAGDASGYRHRARLMVRGRPGAPKIGLFQEGSHRIADTPRCPIHHPLINRVAGAVRSSLRKRGIPPYADAPHRGVVRALQVVVERSSQSAQVVLVENAEAPVAAGDVLVDLQEELGDSLHSLFWNGNPDRTNTVLGPHWERLAGPETVVEALLGARVHFPPDAFGQSNLPLADRMLERIASWVPVDADIAELYAGCGAIGLACCSGAPAWSSTRWRRDRSRGSSGGSPSCRWRCAGVRGSRPVTPPRASTSCGTPAW